jgi:uncharacterized protein HemX
MTELSALEQYKVIYLLAVLLIIIFAGVWKGIQAYGKWQSGEQEKARKALAEEQEKTRKWQEEQGRKRDAEQMQRDTMWREFYTNIQDRQESATENTQQVLSELVKQIGALTLEVSRHDTWAREAVNGAVRSVTRMGAKAVAEGKGAPYQEKSE